MDVFEERTKKYFLEHGITINKLPEKTEEQPDFEDSYQEILIETKHYEGQEEFDGPDPTFNAIKGHLKKASKQLEQEDPNHKQIHIIILFSSEIMPIDIESVLTGLFIPPQRNINLKSSAKLSRRYKKHIDIIAFFADTKSSKPLHVWITEKGQSYLKNSTLFQ